MLSIALAVYLMLLLVVALFFVGLYRINTRRERMLRALRRASRAEEAPNLPFMFKHTAQR